MSESKATERTGTTENGYRRRWWKEAVVYQVYPRSFMDSNGDGIGDLPGLTAKLDHIAGLGIDIVWLSPHFDSPNADNGYDIRDYRKVMTEFGTMTDFDALLAGVKQRGMRLVIDLVVNHTSDEHRWFVESRKSKDNPYRDYYIWHEGRNGKPPNDWVSFFFGSAWTYDGATGEYYLHLFAEKQPDLNWDNEKVREEVFDLMRFWLDKGVDGFRMDVIPFISKDRTFPDYPEEHRTRPQNVHAAGPKLHDYLQEMHRKVLLHYDATTIGEATGVSVEQTPLFVDERRHELDMIFHFDIIRLGRPGKWRWRKWTLPEMKGIYDRLDKALDVHCWHTVFLSNHDSPRVASHYGDDEEPYRVPSAKLLATLLLTIKGTPFIYQGDELGMTNYPFKAIVDFDDIEARNGWKAEVDTGKVPAADFIAGLNRVSRDHARTPMQWDGGPNGGFTTGRPWLAVNPNSRTINAKQALADPDSIYHYFAKVVALRRKAPTLIYGDYHDLAPEHPSLYAYTRSLGAERYLIALNFSREDVSLELPGIPKDGEIVIANKGEGKRDMLSGWEARILRL